MRFLFHFLFPLHNNNTRP